MNVRLSLQPPAHTPALRRGHNTVDWLMAVLIFGGVLGILGASLAWSAWGTWQEAAGEAELHGP